MLATGVDVPPPQVDDLEAAIAKGLVRYCPICDGFEVSNLRIGVLGGRPGSIDEAHFLLTYSGDVTFMSTPDGPELTPDEVSNATRAGTRIEPRPCTNLTIRDQTIQAHHPDGAASRFDVIYPCLGSRPRGELAEALGAQRSKAGELVTNAH